LAGRGLVSLFEKQMIMERETARSFRKIAAKTKNVIPRLLFKEIELDTTKHAHMYATLIELSTGAAVSKIERYDMRKALEEHVANEKRMLAQAQRITRTAKEPQMKSLLNAILADERRHHKALLMLLETVAVEEKISEDDWWRFLNKWAVFST
jgi:rubrerythrin